MSYIALLLPELEAGGAQRVMLRLASELATRGHNVDLVLLQARGPLLQMVPKNVKLVDLATRTYGIGQLGFIFSSVLLLTRWINKERPEVLLSTITGANLVALLSCKLLHTAPRVVVREAVTLKNVGNAIRLRAMRWLYPQADAVVVLTPVMARELVDRIGVSEDLIHCINNPVDSDFIREQAGLPVTHPWLGNDLLKVVVSVGRLVPQKDYVTLMHAFALLPDELHARLIIVGEGPERAVLERLAVKLGISKNVQMIGFDANPWRWMARANLFVLSSRWEGYPNVLLEALVLGLPAVVTEYDASVSEIAGRYNFEVVPVADPGALAAAQQSLLRGNGRLKRCSLNDELAEVAEKYLGALGCSASTLSRTVLDHKATSRAQ